MKNKDTKIKKSMLILVLFLMILTFAGGTLAYWTWYTVEEEKTVVEFIVDEEEDSAPKFSCAADGGGDITSEDVLVMPSTCTDTTHAIQREITTMATFEEGAPSSINYRLWLDIVNIESGLSNSQNFMYALTTSSTSCTDGVVSSGNFNGKSDGDTITILDTLYSSTINETYYLYIWLDEAETSVSTASQPFDITLGGTCESDAVIDPEAPVISDGMIPVTISQDGTVKTVSEDDSSWYDYSTKKWANMVLVTDDSRDTYEGTTGTTITQSDILAYYTWIPRYKYKIWTTTESAAGEEQEIEILFESKSAPMELGTEVDEYRTHPAFWWDENSDGVVDAGEMVAGIWVGKFETSTDTSSKCYTSTSETNCNNANQSPRILPNVRSLIYQSVSNQFMTSQKFSESGNIYGLSNLKTDAHMMKNSEWGAVAYLSHSTYGINSEIYINNSSTFYTGRSGGNVGSNSLIYYNYGNYTWLGQSVGTDGVIGSLASDTTLGTKASSTGNITGVYDMSGGAWEYVMGVLADSSGNPRSGYDVDYNSGFNGLLSDDTSYTSGIAFPALKYYDLYIGTTSDDSCNGGKCYGHTLSETANWYGDYAGFVSSDYPWFVRGGGYQAGNNSNKSYVGVWNSDIYDGGAFSNGSWRSVLTPVDRTDDDTVTVTYYNGVTKIGSATYDKGTTITLSTWSDLGATVIRNDVGWSFSGWSTSPNSYSRAYSDGASVELTDDISLFAVYTRSVTYEYGVGAPYYETLAYYWNPYGTINGTHISSIDVDIPVDLYDNWEFIGWRDDTTAGVAEITHSSALYVPVTSSYYIYAVFRSLYTISYDGNGSTSGYTTSTSVNYAYLNSASDLASVNATVTMAANGFTKSGYTFSGWNTAADGSGTSYSASTSYNYSTTIAFNAELGITLYAQWEEE